MNADNDASEDDIVVVIDETNSVVTGPGPASESTRRAFRELLEKKRRVLELKEKMDRERREQEKSRPDNEQPPTDNGPTV